MHKLSDIQSNYDAPVSGFSEGKLRDNPGDDTGSGVLAAWGNDLYYAMVAAVKRWKNTGTLSSAPESENASDFLQAMEEMAGVYIDGVANWSAATTYTVIGAPVMRYGMQFVNLNASNLNNDPMTNPLLWMAVPDKKELLAASNGGRVIWGDSSPQHDYSNAAYAQYFSAGRHRFGGASGAVYQAYMVHLDGSAVGAGGLSDIIEAWHLKDAFAPGTVGSRTLVDGRNCVPRAVSAFGGLNPTIGARLEDAFQGHRFYNGVGGSTAGFTDISPYGVTTDEVTGTRIASTTAAATERQGLTSLPKSDGTNGTPRTAAETRVKSIAVGVPYFYVLIPA